MALYFTEEVARDRGEPLTKPGRRSDRAGKVFVISAPSGCGKTTLCQRILDDKLGLVGSISVTTRPPRPEEIEGVDYHFVSEKRFREMVKKKAFLEHEENFGYLYGTPAKFVSDNIKKGNNVLLSIDVKGAMKPQDMKNELVKRGIVKDINVVGTSATTKAGCIELVNVLMDAIIGVKHA